MTLTPNQQLAFDHVEQLASRQSASFYTSLADRAPETHATLRDLDRLLSATATIEINFHPDRTVSGGLTVADGLLRDGLYRSQFETLVSNGSRTAFLGGFRANWEDEIFGGHYTRIGPSERPKYGALNVLNFPDGSSPRFGGCYFVLDRSVVDRTTLSYGDSSSVPKHVGTTKYLGSIWHGFLDDLDRTQSALGIPDLTPTALMSKLELARHATLSERLENTHGRILDHYIEAQIHGDVNLYRDVQCIVADPSFCGTEIGGKLEEIADRFSIELAYHRGFVLNVSEIPDDFRGASVAKLARHLACDGMLTARDIGAADRSLHENPDSWSTWGSFDETLQYIKQLWHAAVQYGDPQS